MDQPPIIPMSSIRTWEAPIFDTVRPWELCRYFNKLEYLLSRAHITDEEEKKHHAAWFADPNEGDLWELLPEYADVASNYEAFKQAIC